MKYFNDAWVFYMFLTLDIRRINDIRLISRPIHAPSHELEDTDINTSPQTKLNSVALVRERTIPTERPPPVGEVSANFCG